MSSVLLKGIQLTCSTLEVAEPNGIPVNLYGGVKVATVVLPL